jgi:pyrimidine-specific ribonucleoside hydrolase
METGDPDDFFTLAFLCTHPDVALKAVTVTPGTPHQVGVVHYCLERLGLQIPVGAFNLSHGGGDKTCVSPWHYNTFGNIPPRTDALPGWRVLEGHLNPDTTLVTGAPLKNVGKLLSERPDIKLGDIVVQGGFAGEGVVPPERQLPKFRGKRTRPTYNLNGDPKSALRVIASTQFTRRRFVSKNVCHGVVYDQEMHARVMQVQHPHPGLKLIQEGMDKYLRKHPEGKKFHDPLAACCAIDPEIGQWSEVELFREGGEWGARLCPGSGVEIITGYDHERFLHVLLRT